MLIDEVAVSGVIDQIFKQGMLVLISDAVALDVDTQLFVDLQYGLTDVPPA